MPHAGGLNDQPATWVDAAIRLEGLIGQFHDAERRQAEERAEMQRRKASRPGTRQK